MQSRELGVLSFSVIFVRSSALNLRGQRGLQPATSVVHKLHKRQRLLSVSKINQTFASYDDRLDLFGGGRSLKILLLKKGGDEKNSSAVCCADAAAGGCSGDSLTGHSHSQNLKICKLKGSHTTVQRILHFVQNISEQPNLTSRETAVTQFHTSSPEEGDGLKFKNFNLHWYLWERELNTMCFVEKINNLLPLATQLAFNVDFIDKHGVIAAFWDHLRAFRAAWRSLDDERLLYGPYLGWFNLA